jgi:endoglucanase
VSLNWGASSGTVSQYLIERATGATSTAFSQIATSTTTSLNDGGRAANTTYRYRVRAQNSAGTSGYSGITNCTTTGTQPTTTTTTSQPPPPGGCTGTYQTTNSWSGGFQGAITVRNTSSSTITSWRITFSLGGATINNFWGGRASGTGSYINEPWNGTLAPNATTTFGFVANGAAPSSVTVTCTTPA